MIAFSYSAPNLKNPFENPNTQFVDATYYFDQNTKVHSLKLAKLKESESLLQSSKRTD